MSLAQNCVRWVSKSKTATHAHGREARAAHLLSLQSPAMVRAPLVLDSWGVCLGSARICRAPVHPVQAMVCHETPDLFRRAYRSDARRRLGTPSMSRVLKKTVKHKQCPTCRGKGWVKGCPTCRCTPKKPKRKAARKGGAVKAMRVLARDILGPIE